jgi:type I restriction enzyme, R subunit
MLALVASRFNLWLGSEEKAGTGRTLTAEGVAFGEPRPSAVNVETTMDGLMDAPVFSERGGLLRARALFGARLPRLLEELTDVLVG